MRRRLGLLLLAGMVVLFSSPAFTEGLAARVRRLHGATEYGLARALIEDEENRGARLTEELRWLKALLGTDADRFDRQAAQLMGGKSAEDSLAQAIVLARSQEQFAQGQYLSALENLRALPPGASVRFPTIPVFRAMAAQAVGEIRAARQELEALPRRHPEYASAQVLLSDLSLRARDGRAALDHADNALDRKDRRWKPQALHAKAEALDLLGQSDDADDLRQELRREYPKSVEASIRRSTARATTAAAQPDESAVAEEEAPPRRSDFALQLGAFHDRSLALRRAQQLLGTIEELRVERDHSSSPSWYRVVGGRYPTRSRVEGSQRELEKAGIESVVLGPGSGGR
jgi:cell division septation protein DedD